MNPLPPLVALGSMPAQPLVANEGQLSFWQDYFVKVQQARVSWGQS